MNLLLAKQSKRPHLEFFFLISIGVTLSMFILTQWPPHSIYVILFSWKVKLKVKISGYKSRSSAAVHKTHKKQKKKERKIGQYPAILTLKWSITRMEYKWEWVRINLLKITALLKLLQIRTLFMNDILQYVSLYIYLPLDLNKHRHGAEWPDMFNIHTSLAVH